MAEEGVGDAGRENEGDKWAATEVEGTSQRGPQLNVGRHLLVRSTSVSSWLRRKRGVDDAGR